MSSLDTRSCACLPIGFGSHSIWRLTHNLDKLKGSLSIPSFLYLSAESHSTWLLNILLLNDVLASLLKSYDSLKKIIWENILYVWINGAHLSEKFQPTINLPLKSLTKAWLNLSLFSPSFHVFLLIVVIIFGRVLSSHFFFLNFVNVQAFGSITNPLIQVTLFRRSRPVAAAAEMDPPSLEDIRLLFLENREADEGGSNPRRSNVGLIIRHPTSAAHYFWRRFDDRFMRPIFGGRGFMRLIHGSAPHEVNENV